MGTVWRATQTEPVTREVALKVIKPGMDTREVVARFRSEQQTLAVMDHTGIAKVLDAGVNDTGLPYFVMELVRGVPLDDYCDTHRLGTEDRIELFVRVCEAVHHAHQKGVIHRDLKPSNILVAVEDRTPIPKVIDFGIAKAMGLGFGDAGVTTVGQMLGTPAYMSPEQAENGGLDLDTRTDVYSLGVVLYELLSGTLPFDGSMFRKPVLVVQHLLREKDVPTPSARFSELADTQRTVARNRSTDVRTLRRELKGDLDWIVMRAVEKDRTRRYAAVSELSGDLRRYLAGEAVLARPPSALYLLRKAARRHRGALAAGIALLLSLAVGATVSTVGFVRAARSADAAEASAARALAANDFLTGMLQAADPVSGSGPRTTIQEVLDAASAQVADGSLEDTPLVEVAVRRSIGASYLQLGLFEAAEAHLVRARELLGSTPGASDLERLLVLQELGQAVRRGGRPAEAEALYRRALDFADSTGLSVDAGEGEWVVNGVRSNLGLVLEELDRVDEAAVILEALVDSERRLRAPDDLDLATSLNNLALVKAAAGDTDGALELFEETLVSLRAALGGSHLYVAAVMESMAVQHQRRSRLLEADSLFREAQAMRLEVVGTLHPHYHNGLNNLGLLRREMGDLEGAESYLSEAVEVGIELLGADHPRVGNSLHSLGLVHLDQGDPAAAEDAFRRAVEIREAALGPDHRNTLNARANLANALRAEGRLEEAEAALREVVAEQRALGIEDAVLVGSAARSWGAVLADLGRYGEAEGPLLEAYQLQQRVLGLDHRQTRESADDLIRLYESWGRPGEAEAWRGRREG